MHIEAIVIRKMPVREHDQWVVLYTREEGKIGAVARGSLRAHSKQSPALDEGNMIQCELVFGKSAPIITSAHTVRSWSTAKRSGVRWAAILFFLQVFDTVIYESQSDERLWGCLLQTIRDIDVSADGDAVRVFRMCQLRMLDVLGYGSGLVGTASEKVARSDIDDAFEQIAQRRLSSLDLFYSMASRRVL